MLAEYQQWIDTNVSSDPNEVRGRCGVVAGEMIKAFPELRMRHGTFGDQPHWWCVDLLNNIIDPTRHQFPFDGQYDEIPQRRYTDTAGGRIRVTA